jgi:hypothetical protein
MKRFSSAFATFATVTAVTACASGRLIALDHRTLEEDSS